MTRNTILTVVVIAIIGLAVAAVVAMNATPESDAPQPSPHALDQTQ